MISSKNVARVHQNCQTRSAGASHSRNSSSLPHSILMPLGGRISMPTGYSCGQTSGDTAQSRFLKHLKVTCSFCLLQNVRYKSSRPSIRDPEPPRVNRGLGIRTYTIRSDSYSPTGGAYYRLRLTFFC